MQHTHASLARGTELIMVRDNLSHASISTTSTYLHGDEVQRARQFDQALTCMIVGSAIFAMKRW